MWQPQEEEVNEEEEEEEEEEQQEMRGLKWVNRWVQEVQW